MLHTICLALLVLMTMGQTTPLSNITYIAEIPFVVKTGIFSNASPGSNQLTTLSGSIKIALLPRNSGMHTNRYITLGKPLPVKDYKKVEYACIHNNHPNPQWLPIKPPGKGQSAFPFGNLLADLSIPYGDSATLFFRYKTSGQILQRVVFYRPELLPVVEAWRQKDAGDPIDNKIKSLTANDPKKQWIGFDSMKRKTLSISPGKRLDLLIQKNNFNTDSCILYRVYKTNEKALAIWHQTGHLLSLDSLASNNSYILEIRYQDMRLNNTYQLDTLPRWYEAPLGRAILVCFAITILVAGPYQIYRYRTRREKNKRKRLEEQLTTVQTQLNPHFVFNALSSIEGLVSNQENDRANEYLSSFSDIMRDTLKHSREPMIPLSQDLDTLEKYLRVEQLRFEFMWMMEIDPELDLDLIEFPPMLLQPVVENAIKHGISGHGKDGLLVIAISKQGTDLVITVEDNGGKKDNAKSKGHGYGLQLTRDRIERLRELYKTENIQFTLLHNPTHTIATYYFENWIPAYENDYH